MSCQRGPHFSSTLQTSVITVVWLAVIVFPCTSPSGREDDACRSLPVPAHGRSMTTVFNRKSCQDGSRSFFTSATTILARQPRLQLRKWSVPYCTKSSSQKKSPKPYREVIA